MYNLLNAHQVGIFWSRVDVKSAAECWNWLGHQDKNHNAVINFKIDYKTKKFQAARVALYLSSKEVFDTAKRLSKACKNKLCCNPTHMLLRINKINNKHDIERKCIVCNIVKAMAKFDMKRNQAVCTNCRNKPRIEKVKLGRANGSRTAKFMLTNYKYTDRTKHRENDLTLDFIEATIKQGCRYCGEPNKAKMTLDRIDNSIGHLQSNVNPCCVVCNYTRATMPYEAWLIVIPSMRKIKELKLLDGWTPVK